MAMPPNPLNQLRGVFTCPCGKVCRTVSSRPIWSAVASGCSLHGSFAPRAKKPRRGGLSIEEPGDHPPSFCFSAARGLDYLLNSPPAAPLKNKKKGGVVGGAAAINRPPLTGFEPTQSCRSSRPGVGPEGSQIIRVRSRVPQSGRAGHRFGSKSVRRYWTSRAAEIPIRRDAPVCRRTPEEHLVNGPARGFTLIEVLLAIGIAAGILMVVLFFYRQSETLRTALLDETSRIGAARLIMDRLSLELSEARRCEFFQQGLSGGADNLRFVRLDFPVISSWTNTNQTSFVSAPAPTPFRLVSYSLVQSTNGSTGSGLVRSEQFLSKRTTPVLFTNEDDTSLGGGNSAPTNGLAIEQIQFLRFRYYDGTNWLEAWSAPGLPVGIDVSLGVEPLPPELTPDEYPFEAYRRIIYLPNHAAAGALAQAAAGAKEGP